MTVTSQNINKHIIIIKNGFDKFLDNKKNVDYFMIDFKTVSYINTECNELLKSSSAP